MKANELHRYLTELDGGRGEDTVDLIIAGDGDVEITGIAVGWMSYTWALREAVALGCNVFITHEPTFCAHRDNDESIFRFPAVAAKRQFIADSGLVVIRCHDLWDKYPRLGIPDSWAETLGMGEAIDGEGYFRVYDAGGESAIEIARRVARRTQRFGQPGVQLIGPADKPVHRVAVGTGAITPYAMFIEELRADLAICSDDGSCYWRDGALAIETGIPLLVVHHQVSEEPGMIHLAQYLGQTFGEIPVHHIAQRCMYQLVTG